MPDHGRRGGAPRFEALEDGSMKQVHVLPFVEVHTPLLQADPLAVFTRKPSGTSTIEIGRSSTAPSLTGVHAAPSNHHVRASGGT